MVKAPVESYKPEVLSVDIDKFKSKHLNEFFFVSSCFEASELEEITRPSPGKTMVNIRPRTQKYYFDGDSLVYSLRLCKIGDWAMVGRTKGCQLIIDSDKVSRDHCKIFIGPDGQIYFLDADSGNGTFVNGDRLTPYNKKMVHDKDLVGFGPHQFSFYHNGTFYLAVKELFKPKKF